MSVAESLEEKPKVLFITPGQGCQGFIDESYQDSKYWGTVNDILGYKLSDIIFNKKPELNETRHAQPAIVAATIQDLETWQNRVINYLKDLDPTFNGDEIGFLGNSIGEISSSYGAGYCSREIALILSRDRGTAMQKEIPEMEKRDKTWPFMSAIMNVERKIVKEVCKEVRDNGFGSVHPSNYNSDVEAYKQTLISGDKSAVGEASVQLEERITSGGIIVLTKRKGFEPSVKPLYTSPGPFHTEKMFPAEQVLEARAEDYPFYDEQRVSSGKTYVLFQTYPQGEVKTGKKVFHNFVKQMSHPIELCKTLSGAAKRGFKYVFECGPGGSMGAIIKRRGGFKLIKKKDIK